ncbi:MAG: 2-amino-4-hydroxy-6-hydroxymethyldihydropteridine diphosphokinase, partial [Bacteroidales bacterium]|nr:2-amino-4-hydroxy-6-hydroxymethyldihydropteridine diphosphokinase [Bacteroidales bacterium]
IQAINKQIGKIKKVSSIYQTAPWGFNSGSYFLNTVIKIETGFDPYIVLKKVLQIEKELGRTRSEKGYQSRVIDIDILLMGDLKLNENGLEIPHPRLHKRRFTLVPLAEIAGHEIHPTFNLSIDDLAEACTDMLDVSLFKSYGLNEFAENEL